MPMTRTHDDRFTGRAAVRAHLERTLPSGATVAVVDRGKNAAIIDAVLAELDVVTVPETEAEWRVIGTLSPGPMLDAAEARRARGETVIEPCVCGLEPANASLS